MVLVDMPAQYRVEKYYKTLALINIYVKSTVIVTLTFLVKVINRFKPVRPIAVNWTP